MPMDHAGGPPSGGSSGGSSASRGVLFRLSTSQRPEQQLEIVDSIVHNLRAILNSDHGISPSAPELGLSLHRCLQDWDSDQPAVLASIAEQINRFEPRLTDVEVEEAPQSNSTRFSVIISATLADGRGFKVRTHMTASGAAEVEQVVTKV